MVPTLPGCPGAVTIVPRRRGYRSIMTLPGIVPSGTAKRRLEKLVSRTRTLLGSCLGQRRVALRKRLHRSDGRGVDRARCQPGEVARTGVCQAVVSEPARHCCQDRHVPRPADSPLYDWAELRLVACRA